MDEVGELQQLNIVHSLPFQYLVNVIISQQLSTSSANAIIAKFVKSFTNNFTAEEIITAGADNLKSCGISLPKATYILHIAEAELQGKLQRNRLQAMSNQEIIAELTAIKGVGVWTAKMFLLFYLHRENVLPVEDLIIKTSIQQLYKKEQELSLTHIVETLNTLWNPYQSYASRYLWQWNNNKKRVGT
jgi:DNA-3-methyladenine glycosylase II